MIPATDSYPLWHGSVPIRTARAELDPTRSLVSAKGCVVVDLVGREYLDARSNLWNVILGYDDDKVNSAVVNQLHQLSAGTTIRFEQPPAVTVEYARRLVAHLDYKYRAVRICQTGSQAVEGALLLSRFLRSIGGEGKRLTILAFDGSWHGVGAAAGAVSGEPSLDYITGPLLPGVAHLSEPACERCSAGVTRQMMCECEYNVLLELAGFDSSTVSALIFEPILGTRKHVLSAEFLLAIIKYCKEAGIHTIADEISTGFGRTGALSLLSTYGTSADMLLFGKGMTNGLTSGSAIAVSPSVYEAVYDPPSGEGFPHGSTADGSPLVAAAGLAVLDRLEDGQLYSQAREMGAHLIGLFEELARRRSGIGAIRGVGLMLGVALVNVDGSPWTTMQTLKFRWRCEELGVLLHSTYNMVHVSPPLIISLEECRTIVAVFERALDETGTGGV